jgi:hypothetical protein
MCRRGLSLLLTAALISTVAISGCAERVYDPYYHDYHRWDGHERRYYQQWEVETHRPHEDFAKRSDQEKNQYWQWRHSHT